MPYCAKRNAVFKRADFFAGCFYAVKNNIPKAIHLLSLKTENMDKCVKDTERLNMILQNEFKNYEEDIIRLFGSSQDFFLRKKAFEEAYEKLGKDLIDMDTKSLLTQLRKLNEEIRELYDTYDGFKDYDYDIRMLKCGF